MSVVLMLSLAALLPGAASLLCGYRFKKLQETLPSVSWLFLAVVPFFYLQKFFSPDAALAQVLSIGLVAIALCAEDCIGVTKSRKISTSYKWNSQIDTPILIGLAAVVIIVPLVHVFIAGDIPVLHRLDSSLNSEQSAMVRENFAKLLKTSDFLKLLFNWVPVVAGPLLCAMLYYRRNYRTFLFFVFWCSAYAIVSSARLPLVLFFALTATVLIGMSRKSWSTGFVAVVLVGFSLFSVAGIIRGETLINWFRAIDWTQAMPGEATDFNTDQARTSLGVTPADTERLQLHISPERPMNFSLTGDYAIYRAFLSPMEVSNRWYEFFPKIGMGWRSATDLLPVARAPNWHHAANRVGLWAYEARFPASYFDTTMAYGSLDADAYSFGGLFSVLVVAVLLFGTRSLFAILRRDSLIQSAIANLGIGFLAVFPFQASLQAILVPQGLLVLVILGVGLGLPAWIELISIRQGVTARSSVEKVGREY